MMNEKEIRDYYAETLKRMAYGPGALSDIIVDPSPENEILFESPEKQYFTGTLQPNFNGVDVHADTIEDQDLEDENNEDIEDENYPPEDFKNQTDEKEFFIETVDDNKDNIKSENEISNLHSGGLIFRLHEDCSTLRIRVRYAKYNRIHNPKVRIKCTQDEYNALIAFIDRVRAGIDNDNENINDDQGGQAINYDETLITTLDNIRNHLLFADGTLSLNCNPSEISLVLKNGDNPIGAGRFISFLIKMTKVPLETTMIYRLKFLISRLGFQRREVNEEVIWDLLNTRQFTIEEGISQLIGKKYDYEGSKIFKIVLINLQEFDSWLKVKENTFYQVSLEIQQNDAAGELLNIPPYDIAYRDNHDAEGRILDFQYRDIHTYAMGINASATWNEDCTCVSIDYLPEEDVKDQSVDARDDDFSFETDILSLKNLSVWGYDDETMFSGLQSLITAYENWHNRELEVPNAPEELLNSQINHLSRLNDNLQFLRDNERARIAFRMANTAMYIQMIISRDPRFKKNEDHRDINKNEDHRDINKNEDHRDINKNVYNNIDFFSDYDGQIEPKYRPFQLAFLLINLKSTFEPQRENFVDLIWFKTGGGKTEAYLALTALSIISRRIRQPNNCNGVSVIMRYTLRLLASQQFERASYLICALEFLRIKQEKLDESYRILGNEPITCGMWVGTSVTPNKVNELNKQGWNTYDVVRHPTKVDDYVSRNRHPIRCCPWCGTPLIGLINNNAETGYEIKGRIHCINPNCFAKISNGLPIIYIDELIYKNPPTLLFATVDKFAQLSFKDESYELCGQDRNNKPDLIIQDELHLITGPIGSMVAMYENVVDAMIAHGYTEPSGIKIVASTATTRNTEYLIRQLYHRNTVIFPPQGTSVDDNFYAHPRVDQRGQRKYVGIIPTNGLQSSLAEVLIFRIMFYAKLQVLNQIRDIILGEDPTIPESVDLYWTFLSYYNSLKDLGTTLSKVSQDIREKCRAIFSKYGVDSSLRFVLDGLENRTDEFTSRIEGTEIRTILQRANANVEIVRREPEGYSVSGRTLDLALASNMISVGIDIPRFNIMLFLGQPRSFAEYIQSSSRVGRNAHGLVINLLNPIRSREMSLYESFRSYHQSYFRYVEPLSATPYTENVIDRLLNSLFVAFMRHIKRRLNTTDVTEEDFDNFSDWFKGKIHQNNPHIEDYATAALNQLWDNFNEERVDWRNWNNLTRYAPSFKLMQSLRDVSPNAVIVINNN